MSDTKSEAALHRIAKENARLFAENGVLRKVYRLAYQATHQGHSTHWDKQGTHGANCPACIQARKARRRCDEILAAHNRDTVPGIAK